MFKEAQTNKQIKKNRPDSITLGKCRDPTLHEAELDDEVEGKAKQVAKWKT